MSTPEGRTVVLGAVLAVGAMLAAVSVTAWSHPAPVVRALVLALAAVAAVAGSVLMLRDLS